MSTSSAPIATPPRVTSHDATSSNHQVTSSAPGITIPATPQSSAPAGTTTVRVRETTDQPITQHIRDLIRQEVEKSVSNLQAVHQQRRVGELAALANQTKRLVEDAKAELVTLVAEAKHQVATMVADGMQQVGTVVAAAKERLAHATVAWREGIDDIAGEQMETMNKAQAKAIDDLRVAADAHMQRLDGDLKKLQRMRLHFEELARIMQDTIEAAITHGQKVAGAMEKQVLGHAAGADAAGGPGRRGEEEEEDVVGEARQAAADRDVEAAGVLADMRMAHPPEVQGEVPDSQASREQEEQGVEDAGVGDAGVGDAGVEEQGVEELGVEEQGVEDAGVEDANVNDAEDQSPAVPVAKKVQHITAHEAEDHPTYETMRVTFTVTFTDGTTGTVAEEKIWNADKPLMLGYWKAELGKIRAGIPKARRKDSERWPRSYVLGCQDAEDFPPPTVLEQRGGARPGYLLEWTGYPSNWYPLEYLADWPQVVDEWNGRKQAQGHGSEEMVGQAKSPQVGRKRKAAGKQGGSGKQRRKTR